MTMTMNFPTAKVLTELLELLYSMKDPQMKNYPLGKYYILIEDTKLNNLEDVAQYIRKNTPE